MPAESAAAFSSFLGASAFGVSSSAGAEDPPRAAARISATDMPAESAAAFSSFLGASAFEASSLAGAEDPPRAAARISETDVPPPAAGLLSSCFAAGLAALAGAGFAAGFFSTSTGLSTTFKKSNSMSNQPIFSC